MKRIHSSVILIMISIIVLLNGCATLKEIAKVQKPKVKAENIKITGLDFNQVHLKANLKITNPNPFSVHLPGFGYHLFLEDNSVLEGENTDMIKINAQGDSEVDVPFTLTYKDLYNSFGILKSKDSAAYKILFDLYFELPVLGKTPVKLEKSGAIPLPKLPKISVSSLKLKNLSWSAAKLELNIKMVNPNKFRLFINNLNYNFNVNGLKWIDGITKDEINIREKGEYILKLPISLNFLEMGRTIYNIIAGDTNINYSFDSDLDLKTSLPMLKEVKLPFNKKGDLKILK